MCIKRQFLFSGSIAIVNSTLSIIVKGKVERCLTVVEIIISDMKISDMNKAVDISGVCVYH